MARIHRTIESMTEIARQRAMEDDMETIEIDLKEEDPNPGFHEPDDLAQEEQADREKQEAIDGILKVLKDMPPEQVVKTHRLLSKLEPGSKLVLVPLGVTISLK